MSVLAIAEHRDGSVRDVTYELISAGREVANALGDELHLCVIGTDAAALTKDINVAGVETIHYTETESEFNHDLYLQTINALSEILDPTVIMTPHSAAGLDFSPALADTLGLNLVTDAVGLDLDDDLTVTREMYESKVEVTYEVSYPVVVTVRSKVWPAAEGTGSATVEEFSPDLDQSSMKAKVLGYEEITAGDIDISEAEILVSVGRGIGEKENLEIVETFADELDATLAASRPIIDNGWLPKNRQVGQSGKTVTPTVYIAIGISGAVQHVAGMKDAETIVAINTDPNAPIFDVADYGIVDDLFDVVPAMIDEL